MAQIVTITNPLTGQPAQVDQLDHTAQQIDDAISRALPGGYYDKWVSQLPGQSLLDNSVFVDGCLVDQRGGYVVPPGVAYTNATTSETGTTETYSAVDRFDGTGKAVFVYNGAVCTCDQTAAVRGYTGEGYGPDRWRTRNDDAVVLLEADGIKSNRAIFQKFNGSIPSNTPLTISALTADGILKTGTVASAAESGGVWDETCQVWWDAPNNQSMIYVADKTIKAAFLDLGDHQKHFYQDENGVWQLNALPNYADTLARCQLYRRQFNAYAKFVAQYIDGNRIVFVFPVSMRTAPSMSGTWRIYTGFTEQTGFTLNTYQTGNIIVVEAVKANHGLSSAWLGVDSSGVGILNAEL